MSSVNHAGLMNFLTHSLAHAPTSTLTDYRDGIQFVLDQTLRLMNKGFHLDDLQYMIQLPPNLKNNPYLLEHYGTLKWSIKGEKYQSWP